MADHAYGSVIPNDRISVRVNEAVRLTGLSRTTMYSQENLPKDRDVRALAFFLGGTSLRILLGLLRCSEDAKLHKLRAGTGPNLDDLTPTICSDRGTGRDQKGSGHGAASRVRRSLLEFAYVVHSLPVFVAFLCLRRTAAERHLCQWVRALILLSGSVVQTQGMEARPVSSNERIIRLKTVLNRTGLSRSTLYRKVADGTFPRQGRISNGADCYESVVNRWIADHARYRAECNGSTAK